MSRKNIAVIMTVFNRKQTTLNCLQSIKALTPSDSQVSYEVYVTDDNSTDGTFDAICTNFPDVNAYKSNGNLFWGRGMLHSWGKAIEHGGYDAYLWVNDDNIHNEDAFEEMIRCADISDWKSVICGTFCNSVGEFTYGGLGRRREKLIPNGALQEIYYMNGNLVLIPSVVVDKVGLIDPHFHHTGGDYDYGWMVRYAGFKILTTTKYIGVSERNPKGDSRGRRLGRTLCQRLNDLYDCPFIENPPQKWYELRKHKTSLLYSVFFLAKMHILVWLPDSIYNKIRRR